MVRIVVFLLLAFFTEHALAQIKFAGVITDQKTGQPVPYVTMNLKLENVYSRADDHGVFKIYSVKSLPNDTLIFTSIGYRSYKIAVSDIKGDLKIYLKEDVATLKEVSISGRKEMILGAYKKKGYKAFTGLTMMTRRFMKKDGYSYLKTVSFLRKTDKLSGKGKARFRITIYNSESNSGPPNDVVYEQILVEDTIEPVITVDLMKYHILLPTNFFFIGIERLDESGDFLDPKVNTVRDIQHSWTKPISSSSWRRIYEKPAITATVI